MVRTRSCPSSTILHPAATLLVLVAAFGLLACGGSPTDAVPDTLEIGTWGGDRAGVIASETRTHVHINCTSGDFPPGIELDEEGRFSVPGDYLVRAYPVAMGPTMPARFAGVVRGRDLTMTVAVNDTIENQLIVLGPVTVTLGRDPQMGPCPICVQPGDEIVPG